ncbi:cell division protein ZapA [Allofustis seminis]|uniref:cell division protein ZapA n=1 Tax=Allofustis seminis TaxID=166939 RepID=UPI00037DA14E|nr:cell division protein ZapA [Allofustis seminis]
MSEDKRRWKATINHKEYTMIGAYSEEHLRTVSHLANEQLEKLKVLAPHLSETDRAILLALNAISARVESEAQLKKSREQK